MPLTIVKKNGSDSPANPAQGHGGNAEVRCNVMLGNALDDRGVFLQEVEVPLTRAVPQVRDEELSVIAETLEGDLEEEILHRRNITHEGFKSLSRQNKKLRRLDRFDGDGTGSSRAKTVDRCNHVVFKEELERNFLSTAGDRRTQASFFDDEDFVRHLAFPEEDGPSSDASFREQMFVVVPVLFQFRDFVQQGIEHAKGSGRMENSAFPN